MIGKTGCESNSPYDEVHRSTEKTSPGHFKEGHLDTMVSPDQMENHKGYMYYSLLVGSGNDVASQDRQSCLQSRYLACFRSFFYS